MLWIKMNHSLYTAPEVVRISSALKADRLRTVGALYVLWCVADLHATDDGVLSGYRYQDVDQVVNWPGFASAVADQGWIRQHPDGLQLPHFERHNGRSAKRRALDASRKGSVRKMSASKADKNRNREEKRREEKNKDIYTAPSDVAFETLGEFQSVRLTPDQVTKLKARLNSSFESYVNRLDRYSETHPKKFKQYKSHYAVLLAWADKDGVGQQRQRKEIEV